MTIDICVVVHNQQKFFAELVDSLAVTSCPYRLWIWDNASTPRIAGATVRSPINSGDVFPNNRLVALGSGEYVCLLNSDTRVLPGWDVRIRQALDRGYAAVGSQGKRLVDWRGVSNVYRSENVDYLDGHCLCFKRSTFDKYGLFDEKIIFGYCQDSDFGLRLRSHGEKLLALDDSVCLHHGGATVASVGDLSEYWQANHDYLRGKWGDRRLGRA